MGRVDSETVSSIFKKNGSATEPQRMRLSQKPRIEDQMGRRNATLIVSLLAHSIPTQNRPTSKQKQENWPNPSNVAGTELRSEFKRKH
jgi:hypothetical protein